MVTVVTMFPNGRTESTWPRVIGNGGGVYAGQKSPLMSVTGQVRSARRPPEFVIANWTPVGAYLARIASVITLPTKDSQSRPSALPHWSERGITFVAVAICVPRIGAS